MATVLNLRFPCLSLDNPDIWKPSKYQGEVRKLQYKTHWYSGEKGTAFQKPICIYVPYGYDELLDYDVMVLLPGMDMPYSCYLSRAHRYSAELYSVYFRNVLDNLIASKVIKPCIIVTLPYYGATTEGHPNMELDGNQLVNELRYDLLPYMIDNFSTYSRGIDIISMENARNHFGIFGFSYTSTIILKYIMPSCLNLFGWFGASSIFQSDLSASTPVINAKQMQFPIDYLYVGCGDKDTAHEQTIDMYHVFCEEVTGIYKKSDFITLPNTGHDARTYDTAIINCLLKFFAQKTSGHEGMVSI